MNILKRIGPEINPCETPDNKTRNTLYVLFIFTFCLRPFHPNLGGLFRGSF